LNIKNWGGVSSRVAQSIMHKPFLGSPNVLSLHRASNPSVFYWSLYFPPFLHFQSFLGIDSVSRRLLIHDTGVLLECQPEL
jgi:hypothetical protein